MAGAEPIPAVPSEATKSETGGQSTPPVKSLQRAEVIGSD